MHGNPRFAAPQATPSEAPPRKKHARDRKTGVVPSSGKTPRAQCHPSCDTDPSAPPCTNSLHAQAVEFVQTGLPMAGLAVVGGPWKLPAQQRALLSRVYLPWAIRSASNADRLICLHYEEHFDKPLEAREA